MYISSLKRVLLLVLQLSFPKNVPHFRAILRPPETAPPCSAGSAGPIVTPLGKRHEVKNNAKFYELYQFKKSIPEKDDIF